MFDFLKDISTAWSERIRSPFLGSISIVFVSINWKPIWFLLFSEESVRTKFQYFDDNTSLCTLFWIPVVIGISIAVAIPWVNLAGLWIARKPKELLRRAESEEAQTNRIHRMELSMKEIEVQADLDQAREMASIHAAERLKKAETIGGKELAEDIRQDRENDGNKIALNQDQMKLLSNIAEFSSGSFSIESTKDGWLFLVGDQERRLDHRKDFLKLKSDIRALRRAGLIEPNVDAVSPEGYAYLEES